LYGSQPIQIYDNEVGPGSGMRTCLFNEFGSVGHWYRNTARGCEQGINISHRQASATNVKFFNNTVYNSSWDNLWILSEPSGNGTWTNHEITNNLFYSTATTLWQIKVAAHMLTQNGFLVRNNLIFASHNNYGVCWGESNGTGGPGCNGGTEYQDTTTGINGFNTNATQAGQTTSQFAFRWCGMKATVSGISQLDRAPRPHNARTEALNA
jgi:hypothetical protein